MKNTYYKIEYNFEIMTGFATKFLGNSIVFLLAFCMVIYWWCTNLFSSNNQHQNIGDIIFGVTFLYLFIIQKSFNRNTALINLQMNELISSHESANNAVMDMDKKSEKEIVALYKEYVEDIEVLDKELNDALEDISNKNDNL